ncbi:MAG: TolC family protein [Candidatus Omnitrophica bacterium]|nr:TolC family protein [Candidatus Omnitrophota bacterium]
MKRAGSFLIFALFYCVFSRHVQAQETLTWADCLSEARKNHPDLIAAAENIKEQQAGKDITASSFYPQISASTDAGTSMKETTSTLTGVTTKTTTDSYSYGVSGSQVIFNGLKTANDVKAASENISAARQAYRFTSSEIRYDLRSAFVNLLKAQELVRVNEEIVKIRRDSLVSIALRYQSGLEHKGALLTAEANVAEAKLAFAQAQREIDVVQRQLRKEMGSTESGSVRVKGDFAVQDTAKDKPDFLQLVKANPSVLQAVAQKNAAMFGIRSAYGNFSPQLSGSAGAAKASSRWPPKDDQWNLGLSLTMPLFEGGLKAAQLTQAESIYKQAEENERSLRDTAVVSLEQAWKELQDAVEGVHVQQKLLEAAQERSKIAAAQYATGFIAFDNWIIIENDLVKAKKDYVQSQANALLAEASWIKAKGETLEYAQ